MFTKKVRISLLLAIFHYFNTFGLFAFTKSRGSIPKLFLKHLVK